MSGDLVLKSSCGVCGATSGLYASQCKHMTLCMACGKSLAETNRACSDCGVPVTRLIREYNIRASNICDQSYSFGRFQQGLPDFPKKKGSDAKWFIHKEGLKGHQLTDALWDNYKNEPWILENETGQHQYQGQFDDVHHAPYFVLTRHGMEFLATPVGAWYNFNKVAHYKHLTLEEEEEKMKKRRRPAEGFQRCMMKVPNTGGVAFGEVEKLEGVGGGRWHKKVYDNVDGIFSDEGEEVEDEDEARKSMLRLNKRDGDDDEKGVRGGNLDADFDDVEKGSSQTRTSDSQATDDELIPLLLPRPNSANPYETLSQYLQTMAPMAKALLDISNVVGNLDVSIW